MSGCARRRWGGGTCAPARPSDTAAARELEAKLAAMQAEREKQDAAWLAPTVQTADAGKKQTSSK